jgi:hypothetical protein
VNRNSRSSGNFKTLAGVTRIQVGQRKAERPIPDVSIKSGTIKECGSMVIGIPNFLAAKFAKFKEMCRKT